MTADTTRIETWETQYLDLVREILETGDDRVDRTGTGTRAIFGKSLDIDLSKGFPAVTTKVLAWKAVESELLWFLEGSGDERRLAEILHSTRDLEKKTIWTDNAEASYWKPKAEFSGDLGRVYGVQWRHWKKYTPDILLTDDNERVTSKSIFNVTAVDQLLELVNKLKTNPTDRRMIISAWNVGELDQMALPPCHMLAQFFVSKSPTGDRVLSCQMYQRSVDTMLGLPFNIASYALLVHMLAQVTGCIPGRLIMSLGDVHIYSNHLDGAREQICRSPRKPPTLRLNEAVKDIEGFSLHDALLIDYDPMPSIKMKMAV